MTSEETSPRIQCREPSGATRRTIPLARPNALRSGTPLTSLASLPLRTNARALQKRFQLITKTADPRIAKTYLALASDASEGTTIFSYDDEIKEKPRAVTEEEAALARWYEDEEWEARQALPSGRGKGKGKWVSRAPGMGGEKGVRI